LVSGIDQKIGAGQLDPGTRKSALAVAASVRDILLRDPAVSQPVGYTVRVHRAFGSQTDWAKFDSGLPFFAGAYGTFFIAGEKPSPAHFGAPNFGIYVNTVLQCPILEFSPDASNQPWRVAGNLPVLQGGRRTGEIHGFAIYDGQCAIASRRNEPPFLPLTREQYMLLRINTLEDRLKNMPSGQTMDASVREAVDSATKQIDNTIAQMQQELAHMSAAERGAPVAVRVGYAQIELASIEDPEAIPLSVPNPAFFDRSLPASTVQSLAVYLPFLQSANRAPGLPAGLSEDWLAAANAIRDRLDWKALKALVGPADQ
jgi:hypothetical protein